MRRALAILIASSIALADGGDLEEVRKAIAAGQYDAAQAALSQRLAKDPADREALALSVDLARRTWRYKDARRAQAALLAAQGVANPEEAIRADCDRWVDDVLELVKEGSVDAIKYLGEAVELDPSADRLARLHDAWVSAAAAKVAEGLLAAPPGGPIAVLDFQAEGGGASVRGAAIAEALSTRLSGRATLCPPAEVRQRFREAALVVGDRGTAAVKLVAERLAPWGIVRGSVGATVKAELVRATDLGPVARAEAANPFAHAEDRMLQLEVGVFGQKVERGETGAFDLRGESFQLSDGGALRDFDRFQVGLAVSRPAHVYVLFLSSTLEVGRLFPDPTVSVDGKVPEFTNPIEARRRRALPQDGLCYRLDDHPGVETVFVFASVAPIADLDRLVARMEAAAKAGDAEDAKALARELDLRAEGTRGIGGVSEGGIDAALLEGKSALKAVAEVVAGFDMVSRKFTIRHVKR